MVIDLLRLRVKSTDIGRLADDVPFHRLHQLVASRRGRKIELGVERVELPNVVVKRTGAGTGAEVGRITGAGIDAGAVARAVRQVAGAESFGQPLGRPRNVERGPVERVGRASIGRVFDVVKDDGGRCVTVSSLYGGGSAPCTGSGRPWRGTGAGGPFGDQSGVSRWRGSPDAKCGTRREQVAGV